MIWLVSLINVFKDIELAGSKIIGKIKSASTPFLDEIKAEFDENDIIAKIKAARSASASSEAKASSDDDSDVLSEPVSGGAVAASQGGWNAVAYCFCCAHEDFVCCSYGSF